MCEAIEEMHQKDFRKDDQKEADKESAAFLDLVRRVSESKRVGSSLT